MGASKVGLKRKLICQAFLFVYLHFKLQKVTCYFVIIPKSYIHFKNFVRVYGNTQSSVCFYPQTANDEPPTKPHTQDKPLSAGLQHSVVKELSGCPTPGAPARGTFLLRGGVFEGQPEQLSGRPLLCYAPAPRPLRVGCCLLPGDAGSASATDKSPSLLSTLSQAAGTCSYNRGRQARTLAQQWLILLIDGVFVSGVTSHTHTPNIILQRQNLSTGGHRGAKPVCLCSW